MYAGLLRILLNRRGIGPAASAAGGGGASKGGFVTHSEQNAAISAYITNLSVPTVHGMYTSQGKRAMPQVSITRALTGKTGQLSFVANQGRRADGARTVLGPSSGDITYIVIPKAFENMEVTETVTRYNRGRLQNAGRMGFIIGVTRVDTSEEKQYTPSTLLNLGDTISRKLMNGDVVVLNRQPTLWGHGMIAGIVIIAKDGGLTLRIPLPWTSPLGADFDGDEGTIRVPCPLSQAEVSQLMMPGACISQMNSITGTVFSPQFNHPVAIDCLEEDSRKEGLPENDTNRKELLFGSEEQRNVQLAIAQVSFDDSLYTLTTRCNKYNINPLGRKAFLSAAFPKGFFFVKGKEEDEGRIRILDGIWVRGKLPKGPALQKIQQSIALRYGPAVAWRTLNSICAIADWYIQFAGFTIGPYDFHLPKVPREQMERSNQRHIADLQRRHEKLIRPLHTNTIEMRRYTEAKDNLLSEREIGAHYLNMLEAHTNTAKRRNALVVSVQSGASKNKVSQMFGMAGLQRVMNKSIEPSTLSDPRISPHMDVFDSTIETEGYVSENFASGISPKLFVAHAANTRSGLGDVALATAPAGMLNKVMMGGMQSVIIEHGSIVPQNGMRPTGFYFGWSPFHAFPVDNPPRGAPTMCPIDIQQEVEWINAMDDAKVEELYAQLQRNLRR